MAIINAQNPSQQAFSYSNKLTASLIFVQLVSAFVPYGTHAIRKNFQTNWQDEDCFIMTMPEPIQSEQPSREFKNYSGNFLNIYLTAWTWSLVTLSVWFVKKTLWCQTLRWWRRCYNRGAQVAETTVKKLLRCVFRPLVKRWDKCINVGGKYVEK
jgi:hypothetical protein